MKDQKKRIKIKAKNKDNSINLMMMQKMMIKATKKMIKMKVKERNSVRTRTIKNKQMIRTTRISKITEKTKEKIDLIEIIENSRQEEKILEIKSMMMKMILIREMNIEGEEEAVEGEEVDKEEVGLLINNEEMIETIMVNPCIQLIWVKVDITDADNSNQEEMIEWILKIGILLDQIDTMMISLFALEEVVEEKEEDHHQTCSCNKQGSTMLHRDTITIQIHIEEIKWIMILIEVEIHIMMNILKKIMTQWLDNMEDLEVVLGKVEVEEVDLEISKEIFEEKNLKEMIITKNRIKEKDSMILVTKV